MTRLCIEVRKHSWVIILLFVLSTQLSACETVTKENKVVGVVNEQPLLEAAYERARKIYEDGKSDRHVLENLEESMKTQPQIHATHFNDIFRQARKINKKGAVYVSDVVMNYIELCCEDVSSAVAHLEKNGFEVTPVSQELLNSEVYRRQTHIEEKDQFVIWATRQGKHRYWMRDYWRVRLFIRDGKVHRVSALVVTK